MRVVYIPPVCGLHWVLRYLPSIQSTLTRLSSCPSYSVSGPSVAHYFCTPWASLTAGEIPHAVQTRSLHTPSQNSTASVVRRRPRRILRVRPTATISVLGVDLCSRHSTYAHWTGRTRVGSLWSWRLEQSATISTHHDLSLCFSLFAEDSLIHFSIFIMILLTM